MFDSRIFEATTHFDALRVGRMLSGFANDSQLESMVIVDEAGRIVWNLVSQADRVADMLEQPSTAARVKQWASLATDVG